MAQSLRMQRAGGPSSPRPRPRPLQSACYLPVTRLFQLPPACPISSVWRLLARQNNITDAGQEGEGGRGMSER